MLFNSVDFAVFLPVVFILYWIINNRSLGLQNLMLIAVSYVFYGWWDPRFLSLIVFSSLVDYLVGLGLSRQSNPHKRKALLLTSIFVNIGFLGFFKYYNFFADSFSDAFTLFGSSIDPARLNIILPVGISFYTFQTLSYSIDVYRQRLEPTKDVLAFFAYVSFFPQLVAGPIERATNLLPQFYKKRVFNYSSAVDGLRQILWGLFKKIVIADNAAVYVNDVFNNYQDYSGSTLFLAIFFFAFQIYGDFSGYSDIAIGTARLFGFNLMKNFSFPYFSRDIAEFWRRWHISLSTWFRDYVYIPLGGSQGNTISRIRNVFIIFVVSGLWHGANWTFVMWGFLNACYFLPLMLLNRNRKNTDGIAKGRILPSFREITQITLTFLLTLFAWIFFRSDSIQQAFEYISRLFSESFFTLPHNIPSMFFAILIAFILIEWTQRSKEHALQLTSKNTYRIARWALYYLIIVTIIWFGGAQQEFIYFQF
jgi:alginate O-acetyltransferase complex protein AlgI